jgi:hypothetical protein
MNDIEGIYPGKHDLREPPFSGSRFDVGHFFSRARLWVGKIRRAVFGHSRMSWPSDLQCRPSMCGIQLVEGCSLFGGILDFGEVNAEVKWVSG